MLDLNQCQFTGRLTRDTETKEVASTTLTTGSLAVNRKYKDKEEVTYIDFEVWDKLAEIIANYGTKGKSLLVTGRLRMDSWEKDDKKFSKLILVVEDFKFLDKKDS